ncbi:MAG TPA: sigma-70 family RNA polymerase sigma factor, partial [Bryobacteraceae bacterium]|nr:sigma-70 family RNA polymerase sigma factor [Bryobacteraceae bacterium]
MHHEIESSSEIGVGQYSQAGPTDRHFSSLIDRVRANDSAAVMELYQLVQRGVRFLIVRRVDYSEIDDVLHDVFVAAMRAIQNETIKNPDSLLAYLRGIARNKAGWILETRRRCRPSPPEDEEFAAADLSPEKQLNQRQEAALMKRQLTAMPASDREVLVRFYLEGETQTSICESMGLTATQFRLLKWRAKARFVSKCERYLS